MGDNVLLSSDELQSRASNASLVDFFQAHIQASELARLRATDFDEVFGGNTTLLLRCNGAIWCASY